MKNLKTFLLLALLAFTALGFKCGNKYNITDAANEAANSPGVLLSREVRQDTPKGAVHWGKFQLSRDQLAAMDAGIDLLNASALEDGFKESVVASKPQSFYEIYTPPYACVPSPEQRIPSFMVNGGYHYDGTEWDQYNSKGPDTPHQDPDNGNWIVWKKDGKSAVFAAEMVLSFGTEGSTYQTGWMLVCPDMSVVTNAVRHGADHIFLANFPYTTLRRDREPYDGWTWFNATIIHGPGHPLLPRLGRLADIVAAGRLGAGTLANGTKPSIITETPVPSDLSDRAASRGVQLGAGDVIATSSTTIILAVK